MSRDNSENILRLHNNRRHYSKHMPKQRQAPSTEQELRAARNEIEHLRSQVQTLHTQLQYAHSRIRRLQEKHTANVDGFVLIDEESLVT